jgi:uncharacterized protein (DUF305 family)
MFFVLAVLGTVRGASEMSSCHDTMVMGCGSLTSPVAKAFIAENMAMHDGMAINFTGDANVDFARGMIPHHVGALKMCVILYEHAKQVDSELDKMCQHIWKAQTKEILQMTEWLQRKDGMRSQSDSTCSRGDTSHDMHASHTSHDMQGSHTSQDIHGSHMSGTGSSMGHGSPSGSHGSHGSSMGHGSQVTTTTTTAAKAESCEMSMGCGYTASQSAKAFMAENMAMHNGMAINFTGEANVDFVRGMIPHHVGAIRMCKILFEISDHVDSELGALCRHHIEASQTSEIRQFIDWLERKASTYTESASGCGLGQYTTDLASSMDEGNEETMKWWHWIFGGGVIATALVGAASFATFVKPSLNYTSTGTASSSSPSSATVIVHDYQLRSFSAHMVNYLGIGFISGGIVHVALFAEDKIIYATHLCLGVLVYLLRFLINARFQITGDMLKFLGVSVFVSLGTGMVNGSTQHFQDDPKIASVLMTVGFVIVYISFVLRTQIEESAEGKAPKDAEGLVVVSAKELAALRTLKEQHQGQEEEPPQEGKTSTASARSLSWRSVVLALTVAAALFGISYGIAIYVDGQRDDSDPKHDHAGTYAAAGCTFTERDAPSP